MTARVIFVTELDGAVNLICPYCKSSSTKPVYMFPERHAINISCSCGNTYELYIESRIAFRKKTLLKGTYLMQFSKVAFDNFEKVTVTDLSIGGCRLLVSNNHKLNVNNRIKLVFTLDNGKRTKIETEAIICSINGNYIGCKFAPNVHGLQVELLYYLNEQKVPQQP